MTDSHIDNEISVGVVGTSRPSDSIETDRKDSHQLYLLENRDYTDTSPTRDNEENEHVRFITSRLTLSQTVEVTIHRGTT